MNNINWKASTYINGDKEFWHQMNSWEKQNTEMIGKSQRQAHDDDDDDDEEDETDGDYNYDYEYH